MISLLHLELYKSYGDGDHFLRTATNEEKIIIGYNHWSTIENLIQDIILSNKGLLSESYSKIVNERLKEVCDSEETIAELKAIALKRNSF